MIRLLHIFVILTITSISLIAQSSVEKERTQIAKQLLNQGKHNFEDSVIDSLLIEVEVFLEEAPIEYKAYYYHCLAKGQGSLLNSEKALQYARLSVDQIENMSDDLADFKFDIYRNIGFGYSIIGKYDSSKWAYENALKLADHENKKGDIADLYLELGEISLQVFRNLDLANEYYDKAYGLKDFFIDQNLSQSKYFRGKGACYYNFQQYDSAKLFFIKALDRVENLEDNASYKNFVKSSKSILYSYLANINFDTKNYQGALKYDLLSLSLETEPTNLIASYNNLGEDYLLVGKPDSTLFFYQKALSLSEEAKFPDRKIEVLRNLSSFYQKEGQFQKALSAMMEMVTINDTLTAYKTKVEYNRLLREYEAEKQAKAIQKQQDEIDLLNVREEVARLRTWIIIGVVIVILIIGYIIAKTRIKSKAQQAEKLKEIGEFKEAMTGMIAHDLKNPLSILMNERDGSHHTKQVANQMLQLVNNMLDVHKFESAQVKLSLQEINLHHLFYKVKEQSRPLLSAKNLDLKIDVSASINVMADLELIRRVLVNLLTNAIKYSHANGEISLIAETQNDKVRISMKDQGLGIPAGQVNRLFGSFEQFDPKSSGGVASTGLGLTFCKLAIEAHREEINIISEEGVGSTFYFELKVASATSIKQSVVEEFTFNISNKQRQLIIEKLPALKAMKIYQVSEIEELLDQMSDQEKQELDQWSEALLNAAYSNNQVYFDQLLELN